MTHADAVAVVSGVWCGLFRADARFPEALAALGMSETQFRKLSGEVRKVSKRHKRCEILTPAGCGRRVGR